jgi:hypothetical protein
LRIATASIPWRRLFSLFCTVLSLLSVMGEKGSQRWHLVRSISVSGNSVAVSSAVPIVRTAE